MIYTDSQKRLIDHLIAQTERATSIPQLIIIYKLAIELGLHQSLFDDIFEYQYMQLKYSKRTLYPLAHLRDRNHE